MISHAERYKSVRLGWEKPWSSDLAPVTSYVVQLLQSDGTVLETDTVDAGSTVDRENTFDNLIHDTEYKAQVAAVNSVGQGPWSDEKTIKTPFPERTFLSVCIFRFHLLLWWKVTLQMAHRQCTSH